MFTEEARGVASHVDAVPPDDAPLDVVTALSDAPESVQELWRLGVSDAFIDDDTLKVQLSEFGVALNEAGLVEEYIEAAHGELEFDESDTSHDHRAVL